MIVKAKYDTVEYDDEKRPYIVFKSGDTYIASEQEYDMYIVQDAQGRNLLYCKSAFKKMFVIIQEELK